MISVGDTVEIIEHQAYTHFPVGTIGKVISIENGYLAGCGRCTTYAVDNGDGYCYYPIKKLRLA